VAEDVTLPARQESLPVGREEIPLVRPDRRERARLTSYRFRFGLVYIVLAAVVGAAVGTFIVLVGRPDRPEAAPWSTWQPGGSRDASAKQIADHVSKPYRLPSGNQLAVAVVGPPEVQNVAVRYIAVKPDTSTGKAEENDVDVLSANGSIMYILCGLGQRCSIPEGEPSEERHQLLRREALELSLYTFKYVKDVDSVVVFLPPRPDQKIGSSVFLKKAEVRDELRHPLRQTLARPDPPQLGQIDRVELGNIDRLTRPRVFQYEFQQAQDGNAFLVLTPVVLGT
jgi:hypothetical protein